MNRLLGLALAATVIVNSSLVPATVAQGRPARARVAAPTPPSTPVPVPVPSPPPVPVNSQCQGVSVLTGEAPALAAQICNSTTTISELGANDILNNYYGYIVATTTVNQSTIQNKKALGDFLISIFKSSEFTAMVSMTLEIETNKGIVPLAERPLLLIQRKKDGETTVNGDFSILSNSQVSPFFSLDPGNPGVNVRFRVRRVDNVKVKFSDLVKATQDLSPALGMHGWLITALSEPVVLGAITKSQGFVSEYFSDQVTLGGSARISFTNPETITFRTGWGSAAANSAFEITLKPAVRRSLITTKLSLPTATSTLLGDGVTLTGMSTRDWANQIVVAPSTSAQPATTLSMVLSQSGVPRVLRELSPAADGTQQPSERADLACDDLEKALSGAQNFRLNQIDTDLIIYAQLMNSQVLSRYPLSTIGCARARQVIWTSRYGLSLPAADVTIDWTVIRSRMSQIATLWRLDSSETKRQMLSIFQSPLNISSDPTLFPTISGAFTVDDTGLGRARLNASAVTEAKLTCFGTWTKEGNAGSKGFAKFAGSDMSYVVHMVFRRDEAMGLQVTDLEVIPMTDPERAQFAKSDCVSSGV